MMFVCETSVEFGAAILKGFPSPWFVVSFEIIVINVSNCVVVVGMVGDRCEGKASSTAVVLLDASESPTIIIGSFEALVTAFDRLPVTSGEASFNNRRPQIDCLGVAGADNKVDKGVRVIFTIFLAEVTMPEDRCCVGLTSELVVGDLREVIRGVSSKMDVGGCGDFDGLVDFIGTAYRWKNTKL